MVAVNSVVDQDLPPRDWRQHRFGLSKEHWESLRGQAFWVTGAGTGYGRAVSAALAAAGAEVFLSGRRRSVLDESLSTISALGIPVQRCHVVPVDVADVNQVTAAAEAIRGAVLQLHGLVNNAALPQFPGDWPLADGEPPAWRELMETNVTGSWLVTRAALPLLVKGRSMRVLFVSSEAAWAATSGFGPYNVSKAALNSLSVSFATEIADRFPDRDVQVNVLVPGEAKTEMNQGSTISPFAAVPMALALLAHSPSGPNGRFFHRDGRHLPFGFAEPWGRPVTGTKMASRDGADAAASPIRSFGRFFVGIRRSIKDGG